MNGERRKRLQLLGNGHGIIIDEATLDLLQVSRDALFELEVVNGNLLVRFVREPGRAKRFEEALDRTMTRHAKTLEKLAKK